MTAGTAGRQSRFNQMDTVELMFEVGRALHNTTV